MEFNYKLPRWENAGVEPSPEWRRKGYEAGESPAANTFNWLLYNFTGAVEELQGIVFPRIAVELTADADLNNITDIGMYIYSAAAAATIKNAPAVTQGTLLVLPRLTNNAAAVGNRIQIVYSQDENIYIRNVIDSVWNKWKRMYKTGDVIPIENGGTGATTAAKALEFLGAAATSHGRHVNDNCTTITDWNDATTNGWYMGNNIANAPTNTDDGGSLWYFGHVITHNVNYVFQEVYQFTASTDAKNIPKYIRVKKDGTWGAWVDVTIQRKLPVDAILYGAKTDLSNIEATVLENDDSLDDCTAIGLYTYAYSTAASITNAPEVQQSTVLVLPRLTNTAAGNRIQIVFTNSNNIYVRNLQDSTWNEWRRMYKNDDIIPISNGGTGATTVENARNNLNAQKALGFTPVQQGTGIGQTTSAVKIGWSGSTSTGLKVTVDNTDLGAVLTTGTADGVVLPVSKGGTGAKDAATARTNIGLGNVPNVSTNDQTPTYSDTTNLQTLASGEKLNVAFQKIKCAITNLINHLNNKNNPHNVTASQIGLNSEVLTITYEDGSTGTLEVYKK